MGVRREPLLLPVTFLAAGILAAHFFYFQLVDLEIPAFLATAVLVISLGLKPCGHFRTTASCLCFALAGIATQVVHRPSHTPKMNAQDGEAVLLTGCVTNPPVFSPDREQFTLNLTPRAAARITLNLKNGDKVKLDYGQQLEVTAKIRSPRNFQNPDAFDYASYLANQHIYWTGSVASSSNIKVLPGNCGSRAVAGLFMVRTWALDRLAALYPDDPHTSTLLAATLLGETSGVEKRWTSDFRVTGTYHALVISGQHISVLALSILLLLRLFRLRRVPSLCVATVASWLYAFISGMSSPVVRAAGGFTLFLVASYCFRKTRILNILAAVGIAYLMFDPDQLFDPSFQLSFLSAAAIAAFAIPLMENTTEPVRAALKRFDQMKFDPNVEPRAGVWRVEIRLLAETIHACLRLPLKHAQTVVWRGTQALLFATEAVIVSACVQFGLALPMISYFHRLSITGLSANIIVIPLLSLVVPLGFASIITGLHPLAWLTKSLLVCAEWVATWHVRFEPAWRLAAIPLAASCGFAVSLVLLAISLRVKNQKWTPVAVTGALAMFAVVCLQPWQPILHKGELELTAIDVSQGDSLLLAFPDGETMLIDAGGFPGMERMKRKPQIDMGEDVVSPYLWSRRIRHLDYVVLTHGHSDHMAGMPAILDNFHPKALWIGAEPPTAEWKTVQQHAQNDGVKIVPLTRASTAVQIGGTNIRFLAPSPEYAPDEVAKNDDSLVFEVTYGRRSILLTGDAERPVEAELVASGLLHTVTLLKVGHHGSKTSSGEDFISQLRPQFAFISDGYMNQFHHPHPSVLQRLAEHHVGVFRTDEQGLSTFLTDGNKVELQTFR
jgi:competence protein ComEC